MPRDTFQPAVYLLTNRPNGTLYLGCSTNLLQRVYQHKLKLADGFTKEHGINLLVWFQLHETIESALLTEKRMKEWKRAWKVSRILEHNPTWRDLYEELF